VLKEFLDANQYKKSAIYELSPFSFTQNTITQTNIINQ
jgi:hypothetical protein